MTTFFGRVKSVEQSMADTDEPETKLRKDLTAWDLTVFGVAVVVGAGIFTLTARTAGNVAGPSVSLAFVLAAIACGLAALCYAEFASTVPVAGSAYTFSYATFGEFVAWIIGWDLILEFALAASVVAKGWSSYLGNVIGAGNNVFVIGGHTYDWGAAVLIAVLITLLVLGTKLSSRVSVIITAIKVAVVLLVIIVGAFYITGKNYSPYVPPAKPGESTGTGIHQTLFSWATGATGSQYGWYGLLAAASLVFFAFIGFDVVATTAEETKDPQKSLPRGILGSLAIVTILYVGVSLVLTGMVPYTDLADKKLPNGTVESSTLATAFEAHGITWAQWAINIGALAGLTTVVMVMLLGQTRVGFAMARDGLLPRGLAKTGSRGTPVRITLIVGVVSGALAFFFPMGTLEEMVNIGTLFAFVLVCVGVVVLRRTRPDLKRGFSVPFVPLVPILAVIACFWLMINLSIETWLRFLVWMMIGIVVYLTYGAKHSVLGMRERKELPSYDTVTPDSADRPDGGPTGSA
ncbi:amino acid permease [Gordonia sihwensis]|uniref:Putative amino acid transporter n=2 Tax=Gordoniaceae TaxID=85026 RepID=L7LHJ9_9ACTN|nr:MULTISPECIES: amino acid permease [Gordonia]AUH68221.1 amino acid permease [Gordonia sp. YC-JH1]KJR09576.1 amino acid permease [Gordonia sihwensis]KXT58708.1 amino acid permease [Gordonia sp. QH-12]MBY4570170.1 amino acid permease [Gordonia sihwensis]GAC60221.1 putative amino acid transporter [Gordonia sihwensis NBRC 108236]